MDVSEISGDPEVDRSAQEIAADWHDGQASELYSFASTGQVRNRSALIAEIQREIDLVRDDLGLAFLRKPDFTKFELAELEALLAYIEQEG